MKLCKDCRWFDGCCECDHGWTDAVNGAPMRKVVVHQARDSECYCGADAKGFEAAEDYQCGSKKRFGLWRDRFGYLYSRCAECGHDTRWKEVLTAYENPTKSKEKRKIS